MAIHIGKKIKEELYKQHFSVTHFAKRINRTRNVVYNIFERESIDTDLLNKIGKVLNCDFFSVYSAQKEYASDAIKTFRVHEPEAYYGKHAEELERLQHQNELLTQQNEALLKEVAHQNKIIALLENQVNRPAKKG